MRKYTIALVVAFVVLLAIPVQAQRFGKNNVRYNHLDKFYESERFDIWHNFDENNAVEMEFLRLTVDTLESARDWMGGPQFFDHNIEKRIPVLFYKTHTDMESSNLVGGFLPEGVGAFVEFGRRRKVIKADFSEPLFRAVIVHELAHEFQLDIYNPNIVQRVVSLSTLPNGYIEGCAEYIAGIYDPHTRDDIRRREQRMYAANPRLLPTWPALKAGLGNPYTMWSMIPEYLEDKFSIGTKFCTEPLRGEVGLGEFIYDMSQGELGNPDINSEKFDQNHRHYWGTELGFEVTRINKPKPYEENLYFKGRTITPYGHPYPMCSPSISPDGKEIAAITIHNGSAAIVRYPIPRESAYVSKEEREKIGDDKTLGLATGLNHVNVLVKNLTPQLPPVPWEYLVSKCFVAWPIFNGSDTDWSSDNRIAFFARINRDHALVIIDAETGDVLKKIEFESPMPVLDQAFSPSFTPDGKNVVFSASKNLMRDLYIIDIDKEEVLNLTNDERFDTAPVVSPDGSKIVYVGSDGDFQHLFLYDFSNGTKKQITFGRFNDSSPSWSDDGSTVVYISDAVHNVFNLRTFDLATHTVQHWPDFMGGAETPIFAKDSLDTVYYMTFRDDDQYLDQIYFNREIFEAVLKIPVSEYVMKDTGPAGSFLFNPDRDIFRTALDSNQLLNPKEPPERWKCGGGNIAISTSNVWGMFSRGFVNCSNLLETKNHTGFFVEGYGARIFDYTYTNSEKRSPWQMGGSLYRMPLYYQSYNIVSRYPDQKVIRGTWIQESSLNAALNHPLNKFERFEFFSKIRKRSYSIYGNSAGKIDDSFLQALPDSWTDNDIQVLNFFRNSEGSNLSFGTAYVRDTVLYSGNTWGPYHGNAFRAQIESAPPIGDQFVGYTSVNLATRIYRHIGSSSVFAIRGDLMASNRDFGDFIILCGPDMIRGCNYGSVVGNQVGYVSTELRFPIPGTYVLYQGVRGFLFADGAYVGFSNGQLPARKIGKYGLGIQYVIPFIGMPGQTIFTREDGKWNSTFYVALNW